MHKTAPFVVDRYRNNIFRRADVYARTPPFFDKSRSQKATDPVRESIGNWYIEEAAAMWGVVTPDGT